MHDIDALLCLVLWGASVTVIMRDLVLVRVDNFAVDGPKLRGDDLEEVLEHRHGLARLQGIER